MSKPYYSFSPGGLLKFFKVALTLTERNTEGG